MATKTYKCPVHGEFDVDVKVGEELKSCICIKKSGYGNIERYDSCNLPVTRIFKPIHYMDCVGFYGKGS